MQISAIQAAFASQDLDKHNYCIDLTGGLLPEHVARDEQVISPKQLWSINPQHRTVIRVAFSANGLLEGYSVNFRQPIELCQTEEGWALGNAFHAEPFALARTLKELILGHFPKNNIVHQHLLRSYTYSYR